MLLCSLYKSPVGVPRAPPAAGSGGSKSKPPADTDDTLIPPTANPPNVELIVEGQARLEAGDQLRGGLLGRQPVGLRYGEDASVRRHGPQPIEPAHPDVVTANEVGPVMGNQNPPLESSVEEVLLVGGSSIAEHPLGASRVLAVCD